MVQKVANEEEIKGKDGKYRIRIPVYMCGCKFVGKCGIYQLCLCLHFSAPYLL